VPKPVDSRGCLAAAAERDRAGIGEAQAIGFISSPLQAVRRTLAQYLYERCLLWVVIVLPRSLGSVRIRNRCSQREKSSPSIA